MNQKALYLSIMSFIFLLFMGHCVKGDELDDDFYDKTCPKLTEIVRSSIRPAITNDTRMAASLLRLFFHDCIATGCDASVLLDATSTFTSEKNAFPNRNSLRGFEVIDKVKADVEKVCPSTVSCADILALATREAVSLVGGPFWIVDLGRRDSLTANESAANSDIPSPFEPLDDIITKFTSKGLQLKDVVVLSGAHTIGFAQCFTFKNRLYDFNGTGSPDPSLDPTLLSSLRNACPNTNASDTTLVPLDPVTPNTFDNNYYDNLVINKGLLQSDQALTRDNRTAPRVIRYSNFPIWFALDFKFSMIKLGNVGVLTGPDGEIRTNCRLVN